MSWLWLLLALVAALAGLRHLLRRREMRSRRGPRVDDDALRQILATGSLAYTDDDPLDLAEAARAEEEFWNESWDEPEEFQR